MLLSEFAEDFHLAPLSMSEFAQHATKIEDCPALSNAAYALIDAEVQFGNALYDQDIEIG
jgi:hypothetical protein